MKFVCAGKYQHGENTNTSVIKRIQFLCCYHPVMERNLFVGASVPVATGFPHFVITSFDAPF